MGLLTSLAAIFAIGAAAAADYPATPATVGGPLDFILAANDGTPYPLAQHRGKVVLLVNVASKCGLTPQYAALQALYAKEQARGLVIVGVPANDFLGQEPGSDGEIATFCSTTYGVTFPIMAKTTVKGERITPLYAWLTGKSPFPGPIGWNFAKFLVGRDGQIKARFEPKTTPTDPALVAAVERELAVKL